jgi:hypothetical protein
MKILLGIIVLIFVSSGLFGASTSLFPDWQPIPEGVTFLTAYIATLAAIGVSVNVAFSLDDPQVVWLAYLDIALIGFANVQYEKLCKLNKARRGTTIKIMDIPVGVIE